MRSSNLNNFTVKKFGSLSNLKLFDRKEDYKSPDDRTLRTELFLIVLLFFFLSFSIVIDRLRSIILLREKRSNFLRVYFSSKRCKKKRKRKEEKGKHKKHIKTYKLLFIRICTKNGLENICSVIREGKKKKYVQHDRFSNLCNVRGT